MTDTTLQAIVASNGADTKVTENFKTVSPAGMYGMNPRFTTGLTWAFYGGKGFGNNISDGTVTATASATNYVVASRSSGAVSIATTTTNWNDATNYMRLYLLTVSSSAITGAEDYREAYNGTGGGGGGSFTGGTLSSALNEAPQVTIASSATVNIGAAASNTVIVSGTTTVTAFDTIAAGAIRRVRFSGALTLTHNATTLILPGSASITTAAGDVATMESLGSGNWRCVNYSKADGTAVAGGTGTPAGSTKQIQYNNAGSFGAEAGFEYDPSTNTMTVEKVTFTGLALTVASATGTSGFRLPHGSAPTSPTNGDVWTTTAGLYARINGATIGPYAASGGLTNYTEALATASPNNTVNSASLTVTTGTTDVDTVVAAKGAGATLAQVPDSTSAAGNKRGSRATDWQKVRTAAAQVASGNHSSIVGGLNNTASGISTTLGGSTNTASATSGTAFGESNSNSGAYAVSIGFSNAVTSQSATAFGEGNTVSGAQAVAMGLSNVADGDFSMVTGNSGLARGVIGRRVHSSGIFLNIGDAQGCDLILRSNTTNATPTAATSDGGSAGSANQMTLPSNSAMSFSGKMVARQNATGDIASFTFSGAAKNVGGTFSLVGTPTVTQDFANAGATTWALAITADNTNKAIAFTVTGEAAKTIKWVGRITDVECA